MDEKLTRWQTLTSTYLCRHPYMSVRRDTRTAQGTEREFFILEFPDWANVVAVTEENEVVLVRQFRHGLEAVNLEIPGGVVDPGEKPRDAALRELAEETGYVPQQIELLASVSVNPAIQDNYCHLFLATGCRRLQEQHLDGSESISVQVVALDALWEMLRSGEIHHSLNCLAILMAQQKLTAL